MSSLHTKYCEQQRGLMKEVRRLEFFGFLGNFRHVGQLSKQISVQLSLLCGLRTGEVTISPVWLMLWVFLPRTAKSGKLLIIWKYQWEWRSLCRCGSVAVAFANETCSCWDRKPCSLGQGTPRWQGDNCYCKLLLAMHEEIVSVPVLPPLIWS